MLPAHPGTYVVTKQEDGSVTFEPVIFWHLDEENRPAPYTLEGQRLLLNDDAILFPDGRCLPGMSAFAKLSLSEWAGGKAAATPARAPVAAQTAPVAQSVPSDMPFTMTGKKYARKSFWQVDDGDTQIVFELDADVNSPVGDGVTKITRDDFKSSTFTTVDLDALEAPATEPESDEDEDDLDDMV